jgi:hypothetical protein
LVLGFDLRVMTETLSNLRIEKYLAEPVVVGEPDVAGPLAVFPLFGAEPKERYVSFAEGRSLGMKLGELEGGASVRDLVVDNPTDVGVLLYEGEEVLGAQQNRTFDVTVLVAAGTRVRVPVSCVEAGRWDGMRHGEDFKPAPQAAYPELRRHKNQHARAQVAAGMEPRADQGEVWSLIDAKSVRHSVRSETGAMHDIYEGRRIRLAELTNAVNRRDGQLGSLVAVAGRFTVLDFVSRADAFAALHGALVQGYALDALEAEQADEVSVPTSDAARGFVTLVCGAEPAEREAIGLGRDLRFVADGVGGSALQRDGELIQLTAFPDEPGAGPNAPTRAGRIRRPSRRRA